MTNKKTTELSPDLIACVHDLELNGFCYVEKAIDPKELSDLKKRLSEQALAEEQLGVEYREGGPNVNWGDFYDEDGKIRKTETLAIIVLVSIVIERGMNILGVSLPDKM